MKLGGWLVMLTAFVTILTIIGIPTGLNPILQKIGINISPASQLISTNLENSTFWNKLFSSGTGILVTLIAAGGAVIVGFFARGYDTSLVILPFVVFVAELYITAFSSIIKYVSAFGQWWLTSIMVVIFGSLGIGFIMANVDYFANR